LTVDPFGRPEKVVSTGGDGVIDSIVTTSYSGTRQQEMKVSEANGTTIRSRTTTELDALGNAIKVNEDKGGTAGSVSS
jgi:predicted 3-demethylubiquinone-9 3-methyltransferase (glyoxalase superfamily)